MSAGPGGLVNLGQFCDLTTVSLRVPMGWDSGVGLWKNHGLPWGLSWAVFEVICVTELGFPCGLRVADCKA